MATATGDFFNAALSQICQFRVVNENDDSKHANDCRTNYPVLRRAAFESHTWKFAETRVVLSPESIAPVFGYGASFLLPGDFIRPKEVNGGQWDLSNPLFWHLQKEYIFENGRVLTNSTVINLVYIRDETNVLKWSPGFYKAMVTELASVLAVSINSDEAKGGALLNKAVNIEWPEAKATDGQMNPVSPYIVNDLTWGR